MTAVLMPRPPVPPHTRSQSSDGSLSGARGLGMTRSLASGSIAHLAGPSSSTPSTASTSAVDPRRSPDLSSARKARRLHKRSSSEENATFTAVADPRPTSRATQRIGGKGSDDGDGSSSGRGLSTDFGDHTADEDATDHDVIETSTFVWGKDVRGRRMVNQYVRLDEVGRGVHGKVWLCEETDPKTGIPIGYCAIKEVYREDKRLRKLRRNKTEPVLEMDDKVRQEIAIMKRCNHPHVVRLKEVINDPASKTKKIFMVLEYMAGGQIAWRAPNNDPLMTVDESRRTFRDVVLGLEYLHFQGIIHRDIKPANLLWDSKDPQTRIVKISDFGVSHVSDVLSQTADVDALRRKTAGSPAFFAPELCYSQETPAATPTGLTFDGVDHAARGPAEDAYFPSNGRRRPSPSRRGSSTRTLTAISAPLPPAYRSAASKNRPPVNKAIDIWALGVTLYCLLFGTTPFPANNEYELFELIPTTQIYLPDYMGADHRPLSPELARTEAEAAEARETIDLLGRLLEKDPMKRISLQEVKSHPWVLRNLREDAESWIRHTDPAADAADGQIEVTTEEISRATAPRLADDRLAKPQGGRTAALLRATNALGLKHFSKRIARALATPTPAPIATPSGTLTPQRTRSDSGSRPTQSEGHLRGLLERFRSGSRTPRSIMTRRPSQATTDDGAHDDSPLPPSLPSSPMPQPLSTIHDPPHASHPPHSGTPDFGAASRDWSHFSRGRAGSSANGASGGLGLVDDGVSLEDRAPSDFSDDEDDEEEDDDSDLDDIGQGAEAWATSVNGWVTASNRATAQLIYNSRRPHLSLETARGEGGTFDDAEADESDVGADDVEVEIKAGRDRAPPSPLPPALSPTS